MKYLFIIGFPNILLSSQMYVIGAYQCNDTNWFEGAGKKGLGLNTIISTHWPISMKGSLIWLQCAQKYNLQVILEHATKGNSGRDDLLWYCQLYWGSWEAEDSSLFLWHAGCWRGQIVNDTFARNDKALAAFTSFLKAGNILKTDCEHMRAYEKLVNYNIIYHLKIDSVSFDTLPPEVPICSLYVTKVNHITLIGKRLTRKDFKKANFYQACTLSYLCPKEENQLYYCLYWYGNCNLWCDYLEAKDLWIDSLRANHYDAMLQQITTVYNDHSSLKYYYLLDEPTPSYMASNSYVIKYLSDYAPQPRKFGIQCLYYMDSTWFKTYVDSVKPKVLLIQYYPLQYATPQDSGNLLQQKFDSLCYILDNARLASKMASTGPIPFWYVSQSFGQYGDGAITREPTIRELKCMIWLALAHGAKGIIHFLYRTYKESTWIDSGLTNNGNPRYPLWNAAREMNFILKKTGENLIALTSDTVFKSDLIPVNNCNIIFVSDTLMQIGTFYKTDHPDDKYFIIVNRHCLPMDSLDVIVGINNLNPLYLYDCYKRTLITPFNSKRSSIYKFKIKLLPGEGRLFRIISE